MSMTVQLPPTLRERLAGLAARIRLLRGLRGLSVLVLALTLTAAAALLTDWLLDAGLPPVVRAVNWSVWIGLGSLLLWGGLTSFRRRIDPADLAAVVEEQHPELGERLTTSVELCQNAEPGNGSPALIELLVRETEARTHPLDFRSAISGRSTRLLAGLAALVFLGGIVPAALFPQEFAYFGQRFVAPWTTPAPLPDYRFAVSPGDTIAARGRTLAISADLTPRNRRIALPKTATLVVEAGGHESRHEMTPASDDPAHFALTYRVRGDFEYRVEAGNAASDSATVTAVTPVELTDDSPTITVTPPAYARGTLDTETRHGLVDLTALKHSEIAFAFAFNRPAVGAWLEWTDLPEKDEGKAGKKSLLPLPLAADRLSARLTLPARQNGSYRVLLEAEHGIRTERDGGSLSVKPDLPPALLRYVGKETPISARPYDRIPIEVRLADDIGVAGAELVYQVDADKTVKEEPLTLEGAGRPEAAGRLLWQLAGKVKEGDRVRYRIRYRDNLPREFGGPHVLFYPADRWLELGIDHAGKSFKENEILAQRDAIQRKLEAIKADIKQEKRAADKVRAESRDRDSLQSDQVHSVRELRRQNQATEKELRELAREAEQAAEMEKLSELARDVADREMKRADRGLEESIRPDTKPPAREKSFRDTDRELDQALRKLDALGQLNEKLAQERLDQARVEALADRQKQLAEQAAELAGKHPVLDPEAKNLAEKLKKEQEEVAQELKKLTENSETLKKALEEARAQQAQEAGRQADELAQAERAVARASEETERQREAGRLADLAKQQKALAERAEKLSRESADQARAARTPPLKSEPAAKAAEELARGDSEKALGQQDRSAAELDRLANDLNRAATRNEDPREAARHLARLQKELLDRTMREQMRKDDRRPVADRLNDLRAEQDNLKKAAEKLPVPQKNAAAQADRRNAEAQMARAADALSKNKPVDARRAMAEARQTLDQLANKLPSLQEQRRQAHQQVARLRQEQTAISREAEQALKDTRATERRLEDVARRQAALADEVAKLEAPREEARRDQAAEASEKALEDLRNARKDDVTASQAAAGRALERLAQALAGQKPVDEKAAELAKRQKEVAARSAKATPQEREQLKAEQKRLAQEAQALDAGEAQATKRQAAEAARAAAEKADPTSKEARQAMEEAAKKLDELAKATAGKESEAEKAERAARRQAEEAARAQKQPADAAGRQKEVAEEAKGVRAGEEARTEKQQALEALRRAESTRGAEQAKAQQEAAEALKKLADKLAARRNDPTKQTSPRQQTAELARRQADLARQTQQARDEAARKPGEAGKKAQEEAARKAGEAQQKLNEQAASLPARGQQKQVEQARQAMQQALQAARRNDTAATAQKQQEAAQALQRLAQQLPQQAARRSEPAQTKPQPGQQQAERARQLAREQRELRDAVRRQSAQAQAERRAEANNRDNPAGKLAQQQARIAQEAGQLARAVGQEQGAKSSPARQAQQAGTSSQQAAKELASGALPQAQKAAEQSAQQLRKLAGQLAATPRGKTPPGQADTLQQARNLAQRQEDVNRQLAPLARSSQAQRAQQQARQDDLAKQTGELARQLQQLGQTPGRSPQAQASAQQAANMARQAQQAMQQAGQQARQGNQSATQAARNQAAQALLNASRQAMQAAQLAQQASGRPSGQQTGQNVQQAREQMGQAQGQLAKGQTNSARGAMQQAGQALDRAAQQLAQAMKPGQPTPQGDPSALGRTGGGTPDGKDQGRPKFDFDPKKWGELPGELRTRIVQDMKAKYGEDYARMIKLYFEQIADTRRSTKK